MNILVCAKSVIVNKDRMLLLQRARDARISPDEWEIAGGTLEFGESPADCLIREVSEEAGIRIDIQRILYAASVMIAPDTQVIGLTYLSTTGDSRIKLSAEHQAFKWVDKAGLRGLLFRDMLCDFDKYRVFDILP